jgi:hypothetical protein
MLERQGVAPNAFTGFECHRLQRCQVTGHRKETTDRPLHDLESLVGRRSDRTAKEAQFRRVRTQHTSRGTSKDVP